MNKIIFSLLFSSCTSLFAQTTSGLKLSLVVLDRDAQEKEDQAIRREKLNLERIRVCDSQNQDSQNKDAKIQCK